MTATNDGRPLAGMEVTVGGIAAITDSSGRYAVALTTSGVLPFSVSGPTLLTRSGYVTALPNRAADLDAIVQDGTFDLMFYRQIARDQYSAGTLRSINRWTTNPNVYIRTVDSTSGNTIEPEVIASVQEWARRSVSLWTNNQLQVNLLETGSVDRADLPGWIVVDFIRDSRNICGQAYIGRNPGRITFNDDRCSCGSTKVPLTTILHEFGHAMGFFHVADRESIMYSQDPGKCTVPALSENDRRHSAIAYRRPNGNVDPDTDIPQSALSNVPLEPPVQVP